MSITAWPPLGYNQDNPIWSKIAGTQLDAFARHRVSTPYTLFDSQNRYFPDDQFSESLAINGTTEYVQDRGCVDLKVTQSGGSQAVRQSKRVFAYQPGKSLLIFATFVMNPAQNNLRQRVGYFNEGNGIFFQLNNNTKSFVIRTSTSGTASDARTVNQADWNGDKLDGTGPSGIVLDITKSQIFFTDLEWLGVGTVRVGFVINGDYVVCHTFQNANFLDRVYMQTAILPIRYEITNTGETDSPAVMQQICSTVISEGGYSEVSRPFVARRTSVVSVGTSFYPIVSIKLDSSSPGAIVIPSGVSFYPKDTGFYTVCLVKNANLTGATWGTTVANGQVRVDTGATAMSFNESAIIEMQYINSTNQSRASLASATAYNWGLQIGFSLNGNSDTYTLAAHINTGTGDVIGNISLWDLTA